MRTKFQIEMTWVCAVQKLLWQSKVLRHSDFTHKGLLKGLLCEQAQIAAATMNRTVQPPPPTHTHASLLVTSSAPKMTFLLSSRPLLSSSCQYKRFTRRGFAYLSNVFLLLLELAVIIIHLLVKPLAPVNKVTWVDSNLLEALGHHVGHNRLEVDVSHQWHIIPATTNLDVTGVKYTSKRVTFLVDMQVHLHMHKEYEPHFACKAVA